MKRIRITFMVLAVLALTLPLAGCPKDKMMGDTSEPNTVENIG